MTISRRESLGLLALGSIGAHAFQSGAFQSMALIDSARAQSSVPPAPDERTIADAYIYLLGRVLAIRQEHMDRSDPGFAYNTIKYNPLGSADFVNPNFDVAYLEAWIAADDSIPVILEVPEVRDRYYTAQILDEWGEVIANINERTFPSKPFGKFALVKPGSSARIPADASRIELHSSKAKLLGRVELKTDRDGAVRLQKQFTLTALGTPTIAVPPAVPMFGNKDLIGPEIFDDVDARLASALDVAPNAAELQQKVRAVAAYVGSSEAARTKVAAQLKKVVPEFQDYALTKAMPYRNHWMGGESPVGNFGKDFRLRAAVNFAGIWANTVDEVVYFIATRDSDEKPLNGGNSYVMHFAADGLPKAAVNAYWSVILVGVPDYRVVPNPLNRFNFNTYSPLRYEPDGSLKITIGPKPVNGVAESNWLPAPDGKPFSLTFRTYVPKEVVKQGGWQPPALALVK